MSKRIYQDSAIIVDSLFFFSFYDVFFEADIGKTSLVTFRKKIEKVSPRSFDFDLIHAIFNYVFGATIFYLLISLVQCILKVDSASVLIVRCQFFVFIRAI